MTAVWIAIGLALTTVSALIARRVRGAGAARARIYNLRSATSVDRATGAVRSIQTASLQLASEDFRLIWSPENLERLARTYWRYLSRVTLGVIHVRYTPAERSVVLLGRPLRLLTFHAPEYEMGPDRGLVRWRIARGILVARRGHDGGGYLQIEVIRQGLPDRGGVCLHVEVEVANFYPAIASGFGLPLYNLTQSRIHVLVTNGFLRSLAHGDLAESRVGSLAR